MATKRQVSTYKLEEKRDALKLTKELGPTEASKRLGIPMGTLSCWSYQARRAEAQGKSWPAKTAEQPTHREEGSSAPCVGEETPESKVDSRQSNEGAKADEISSKPLL